MRGAARQLHPGPKGKALRPRHHLAGHLPGLHVESFALRPGGGYTDPTGRDDLAMRLEPIDREAARVVFDKAAPQAAEAVRLRHAGEHNAAIAIWHDLLGEDFPQPSPHHWPVDDDRSAAKAFGIEESAAQLAVDGEHRTYRWPRHTPDFPASLSCPISPSSRSSATS